MSEGSKQLMRANVSIHFKKKIEIPKQSPFIDFDTMEFYRNDLHVGSNFILQKMY